MLKGWLISKIYIMILKTGHSVAWTHCTGCTLHCSESVGRFSRGSPSMAPLQAVWGSIF